MLDIDYPVYYCLLPNMMQQGGISLGQRQQLQCCWWMHDYPGCSSAGISPSSDTGVRQQQQQQLGPSCGSWYRRSQQQWSHFKSAMQQLQQQGRPLELGHRQFSKQPTCCVGLNSTSQQRSTGTSVDLQQQGWQSATVGEVWWDVELTATRLRHALW